MALSSLAAAEGEPLILTIDATEKSLVAHDAATMTLKWTIAFERELRGIVYAAPSALPGDTRASPWRSSASSTVVAVAVDDAGTMHVIDPAPGKIVSAFGPFGEPIALAARGPSVALACKNRLRLWHDGVLTDFAIDATALAFGHGRFAIGQAGSIFDYDLAKSEIAATARTEGRVNAVAPHWVAGAWLIGVEEGLFSGERRLASGNVRHIEVDARQQRVAVQRAGTHVAVFRRSFDPPELRVKYTDRSVGGLAFIGERVVIALDRGDANAIVLATSTVTRTERAPERTWAPELGPKPLPSGPRARTPRFSLGFGLMAALTLLAACIAFLAHWIQPLPGPPEPPFCGADCERSRLDAVAQSCRDPACQETAAAASKAFEEGRCADVEAFLAELQNAPVRSGASRDRIGEAQRGLKAACIRKP